MEVEVLVTGAQARRGGQHVGLTLYCPRCRALGIEPPIRSADRRGGLCRWCLAYRWDDHDRRKEAGKLTWIVDEQRRTMLFPKSKGV